MAQKNITDAGVGRALFTTKVQLAWQAAKMCFLVAAVLFVTPLSIGLWRITPENLDLVRLDLIARFDDSGVARKWYLRRGGSDRLFVTAVTEDGRHVSLLTAPQVRGLLSPGNAAGPKFNFLCVLSVFLGIAGYLGTWWYLMNYGKGNQQSQRIRGASDFVEYKQLNRMVRASRGGASRYTLAKVVLPAAAPMTGILALGAQGTGKSIAVHDLMTQVFAAGRKAIIYDQSGEFFKAHFRPGKDFFFNPAFVGSVPWSIFDELVYSYDTNTLATAFLPPKAGVVNGPAAFFEDAARALFSTILERMAKRGARNTNEIAKAILELPADEMDHLISKSVASSALGSESKGQRQGVISSISIYIQGIAAVHPGTWTIKDWLDEPGDSRFFLLGTDDTKAMFAPLFRLLLSVTFSQIAAKAEVVIDDRYWFFLDEVHTLGDIQLDVQLATLRKFGVCVVSGVQAESQFMTSMGKERAETVMNCFNQLLMLRTNEPNMQERIAKRLGKVEMDTVSRNQALAVTEWRDGAGLNKSEHEKWLVMPSEIGTLDDLTGFLKLAGSLPATKVNYRDWLPKKPGGPSRLDRFKPVNPFPPRDGRFLIIRQECDDAIDGIFAEVKAMRDADPGASSSANGSGDNGRRDVSDGANAEAGSSVTDLNSYRKATRQPPKMPGLQLAPDLATQSDAPTGDKATRSPAGPKTPKAPKTRKPTDGPDPAQEQLFSVGTRFEDVSQRAPSLPRDPGEGSSTTQGIAAGRPAFPSAEEAARRAALLPRQASRKSLAPNDMEKGKGSSSFAPAAEPDSADLKVSGRFTDLFKSPESPPAAEEK